MPVTPTRVSLLLAGAVLAAGCCETYKCTPPNAELTVRDEGGRPIDASMVTASNGSMIEKACPAGSPCRHVLRSRELVTLMVTAAGYKPLSFEVRPRSDECGNAVKQELDVVLVPEADAPVSRFRIVDNLTCE